jgi:hypothetical protein
MIVVLPYCDKDYLLALNCLKSLLYQREAYRAVTSDQEEGPRMGKHKLVLLSTDGYHSRHPFTLETAASASCEFCDIRTESLDLRQEWPGVVNKAFHHALGYITKDEPMFWCEPDVTFTGINPLDKLEAEWRESNCDILGHLSQSTEVPGLFMNGVAVYGRHAAGMKSARINDIKDRPFDIVMRMFILSHMWNTDAIGHTSGITGITKQRAIEILFGFPLLVHGVKDNSLLEFLATGWGPQKGSPPTPPL